MTVIPVTDRRIAGMNLPEHFGLDIGCCAPVAAIEHCRGELLARRHGQHRLTIDKHAIWDSISMMVKRAYKKGMLTTLNR